jgi:hypothetical protein
MEALQISEVFQQLYRTDTQKEFEMLFKKWCFWVTPSRIDPIIKPGMASIPLGGIAA